jgi:hypothetical protein
MTILWPALVPGVLLLLFPADRLLSARVELRSFESFNSLVNSPNHRPWWWVPALWFDPLRACLGTLLLKHALALAPAPWAELPKTAYWTAVGTLVLAVIAQMVTRREKDALLAPLGFVAGLAAALVPWHVALLALASAIAALFAFRNFPVFFVAGAAVVGGLGFAFHADSAWIVPTATLLVLPVVVAFLTGTTLEIPTHRAGAKAS